MWKRMQVSKLEKMVDPYGVSEVSVSKRSRMEVLESACAAPRPRARCV